MTQPAGETPRSVDLLGLAPIGRALEKVTSASVDGVAAFLSRICLPAAEELGLLLRDHVSAWRKRNALAIAVEAERLLRESKKEGSAPPRLVFAALEHGSWIENERVQRMWAGLLASSCSTDGTDDSNLIFINLLAQLTAVQAQVLCWLCEKAEKRINSAGLVCPSGVLRVSLRELLGIAHTNDLHRLDREMDHLTSLGLLQGGIDIHSPDPVSVAPSALALNLFARASGFSGSPPEFFGLPGPNNES